MRVLPNEHGGARLRVLLVAGAVATGLSLGACDGSSSLEGRIEMPPFGGPGARLIQLPGRAGDLEVDRERLWIMLNPDGIEEGGASLVRIDPRRGRVTGRRISLERLGIDHPAGYAIDRNTVWALGVTLTDGRWDSEPGTLVKIDARSGEELDRTEVGRHPRDVISAFGAVWVTNIADDTLLRIDPDTLEVLETIQVADGPESLLAAFGSLWVTTVYQTPTLVRIDPSTGDVTATLDRVLRPVGSTEIWVIGPGGAEGAVRSLDPSTNRLAAGGYPLNVGPGHVAAGGRAVWIGKWYPVVPGDWNPRPQEGPPIAFFAYRRYDVEADRLYGPKEVVLAPADGTVAFGSLWVPHPTGDLVLQVPNQL